KYAETLTKKRQREGITYAEAYEKMFDRNYFGMMMVENGDADAFITGTYTNYTDAIEIAKDVIGIRPEYKHFGAMHIVSTKKGTFFLADTLINNHPDDDTLVDIARLSVHTVKFFANNPVMAMISYSNFGANKDGSPSKVHSAINKLHTNYPEIIIDGEMQLNFALNKELRDKTFPFNKLIGQDVNTLIFPNLNSANIAYKLILDMGVNDSVGPIQMGLNKPIHFTDIESSSRDILNLTTVAVIDAIVMDEIRKNKK
ncbi:MAG: phosphate acyltransferase, partial [Bacteroidales bacterium]